MKIISFAVDQGKLTNNCKRKFFDSYFSQRMPVISKRFERKIRKMKITYIYNLYIRVIIFNGENQKYSNSYLIKVKIKIDAIIFNRA